MERGSGFFGKGAGLNIAAIITWLKLAQKIADTDLVQGWRRWMAKRSANELKRMEYEKQIDSIGRDIDDIARRFSD